MKFFQLIECYIFLKNDTQNVLEKLVPDPFLKNQNLAYQWSKVFYTSLLLNRKLRSIEIYPN